VNLLPEALFQPVKDILEECGDDTSIISSDSVGGGCINHSIQVASKQRRYMLKWNKAPLPGMFFAEAKGLQLLAKVHAVRVPHVFGFSERTSAYPAFILLEWIDEAGGRIDRALSQERLGRSLATLHKNTPRESQDERYGLGYDNYIGSTPQLNGWEGSWVRFFREKRLAPQMALAEDRGMMTPERRQRMIKLVERLENWLDEDESHPSLLHGDLWSGNVMTTSEQEPVLVDPAVYYGNREAEIAFTELFGGFNPRFYAAYNEAWPLYPGYHDRKDLYNLYHLLNHMNLFGSGYCAQVDRVLWRYVG
jgi:fructosamine-3-kinase